MVLDIQFKLKAVLGIEKMLQSVCSSVFGVIFASFPKINSTHFYVKDEPTVVDYFKIH